SYTESFPLFGYDLRDYGELFREKLGLLLEIREQNPVTWEGRLRAPLIDADIAPRAYGDTIPIWVGVGGSAASAVSTGRLGLPMALARAIIQMGFGGMPQAEHLAAIERLGTEVAPIVRREVQARQASPV
ncbi:MAG: LLM class flavin-dependent oxidoreductase, partial [Gaiellaceae bacterium]